jgi:hypothetical protein
MKYSTIWRLSMQPEGKDAAFALGYVEGFDGSRSICRISNVYGFSVA